jgi:enterochelin esterase family protein
MTANYWVYVNPGADVVRGAPLMVVAGCETIVGNQDLLASALADCFRQFGPQKVDSSHGARVDLPGSGGEAQGTAHAQHSIRHGIRPLWEVSAGEVLPEVEKSYKLRPDAYSRAIAALLGSHLRAERGWYHTGSSARVEPHRQLRGVAVASGTELDGGYIVSNKVRREPRKKSACLVVGRYRRPGNERRKLAAQQYSVANALKLKAMISISRFGEGMHAIAQGALDLPESLTGCGGLRPCQRWRRAMRWKSGAVKRCTV